jgi:hypothetical protein
METTSLTLNNHPQSGAFSIQGFDHAQRVAVMLAKSQLIPEAYRGKPENCMIALEMANRIGASPMAVMQNLHIIQGRPSWSSPFIIASLNTCGRFHPLKFRQVGEKDSDSYGYEAYTKTKAGEEEVIGPAVTWAMIKAEGWLGKSGSKWKTMPELMFRYRAAAFFGRLYAPDILMGMQTAEEVIDITPEVPEPVRADKEAERLSLLIKEADNPETLEGLKEHIKDDKQMELFEQKMQSFSNVSIA